ncbi:hypothetical protein H2200_004571 [Cladophialophora chaetospira]|uniref:Forkhead domain protein n=1 Tax=Cladophialophora chaetospira TaxID=386627 RepID=A0AA39CJL1_9EURO|nr:hypothetical protein H2200_004571 [Cladophialophora chaetospira]
MSSQTVATSTRGLPDFTPWPDDSTLHRDKDPDIDSIHDHEPDNPPTHSPISSRPSCSELDVQQRNQAVGNLLAALVPTSTQAQAQPDSQTQTALAQTDMFPLPDLPIEPVEHSENDTSAITTAAAIQYLNAGADTSFVHLPFESSELLDTSTLPPLPYPLPLDVLEQMSAVLGPDGNLPTTHQEQSPPPTTFEMPSPQKREKRQVEAFAKLEFDDGNYYITTYACELGRDAFAYKAAIAREEALKAGHDRSHTSSGRSGRRSGLSQGAPVLGDSQVQGSVVSEAGGFGGVDDGPIVQRAQDENGNPLHSQSSEMSAGSIVRPQEVHYHPPPAPFDYHLTAQRQAEAENKRKSQDPADEQPAPVTDEHLPDAGRCPLIPIHATQNEELSEVASHRNISRRHVRIEWSDKWECFQMHVLGRNGAFLDGHYKAKGEIERLSDGSKIQIAGVEMIFKLPLHEKDESPSEESSREDPDQSPLPAQRSTSPTSEEQDGSASPPRARPGKGKTKIILKANVQPSPIPAPSPAVPPEPVLGPDGLPLPQKRRGPGRPPKDGIMSTRERKERERAIKAAEAKAANGGVTPPPMRGVKPQKVIMKEEEPVADLKLEKRKYKKRKREGEDGEVMQSIEGGEMELTAEPEKPPPPKKARSKSPSPEYPPQESLTEEQLARPSEPYARLIYDILIEIHPKALPLKQIYRALKMKFPFFVYRVDSEGWQSSVRHNLNQEWNKLFEKGEKEGKGFAWKAIPGALQPQAERRRATQQATVSKPKPAIPRQNVPQGPPQQLNWQHSTGYPPPQGHHPSFYGQGPNGPVPPPNGMPWPPPPPGKGPPYGQQPPGFYPPAGLPQQQSSSQPGFGQHRAPTGGPTLPPSVQTSTSASRNMPCTLDGLITIKTFENQMLKTVHPANLERWQRIFASARKRLLHGQQESLMPGGEGEEEATIMKHMRGFIERFRNPNFVGFSIGTVLGSPAPALPPPGGSKNSTPQPGQTATSPHISQDLRSALATATPVPPPSNSSAHTGEAQTVFTQKQEPTSSAAGDEMEGVETSTASSAAPDPIT